MANYNEETIEGVTSIWVRPRTASMDMPHCCKQHIVFKEERLAILPDGSKIATPYDVEVDPSIDIDEAATGLSMIDPVTGDSVGEISMNHVKIIIYSLYLRAAQERDASLIN